MNIFNSIKNYFINSKSSKINNQDDKPTNCIIFSINPEMNYEPYVKIRIEDTSIGACAKFVQMLNDVNSGSYSESIISLMTDMGTEDQNIKNFMKTGILYWKSLLNNNQQTADTCKIYNDRPLIMPMDFNKNAK